MPLFPLPVKAGERGGLTNKPPFAIYSRRVLAHTLLDVSVPGDTRFLVSEGFE